MEDDSIKQWLFMEKNFEEDYNKAANRLLESINEIIVETKSCSLQEQSKMLKLFISDLDYLNKFEELKDSKAIKCFYEIIKEKQFALAKIF